MLGATVAIVMTIAALVAPVSAGTRSHPNVTHHRWILIDGKRVMPAITPRNDPEGSALNLFADRVQTLGMSRYPTIFAGAVLRARTVDIYTVRQNDQVFLRAVARTNTSNLPYTVRLVAHSWAEQLTLRNWIASRYGTLRREGIALTGWGPDPELNAVHVALQKPSVRQLADLQKTIGRLHTHHGTRRPLNVPLPSRVTQRTYLQVAAAALNAQIPAGVRIVLDPAYSPPSTARAGSDDTSPFFGGDILGYRADNKAACTGGFSVNSASDSSIHYMITAAHCSYAWSALNTEGHWYTCATRDSANHCSYDMGAVEAIFWNGASPHDYELINTSSIGRSTAGYVWQNQTSNTWIIDGWQDPAKDSGVTYDGWPTGAINDVKIINPDDCETESYGQPGSPYQGTHVVCDIFEGSLNAHTPCPNNGDSGGPVLTQQDGTGLAIANGTIVGGNAAFCWGQLISVIRTEANVRVIFGA
jgi:hypothetical protein